jgi:hypothetical protein
MKAVSVPGYGWPEMVRTPWGSADQLRDKRMPPGRGNTPEATLRSQRERLFGAMVAVSSERGYEATKIADVVKMAGVSRAAFYEHFRQYPQYLRPPAGHRRLIRGPERQEPEPAGPAQGLLRQVQAAPQAPRSLRRGPRLRQART